MDTTFKLAFRTFFLFITAIDLLFLYAALFNRDLPRRLALRFFATLPGQPASIPPSTSPQHNNWLIFALVAAVPPAAWILFELYLA